jgi:ketosteroid isomerase-like protein
VVPDAPTRAARTANPLRDGSGGALEHHRRVPIRKRRLRFAHCGGAAPAVARRPAALSPCETAPSEEQAVAAPINAAYARAVGDPRAVMNRLTAAQNAHDLEGMLACFHEDYHSEQPLFPARTFQGIDQVRVNWSALLENIPDFQGEIVRSAVDGDTVFAEIHWTGTKADGARLDERGVIIVGTRDERIAWGRLYVDEVEAESADIDAVVRHMAGTEDR